MTCTMDDKKRNVFRKMIGRKKCDEVLQFLLFMLLTCSIDEKERKHFKIAEVGVPLISSANR
jgi:hypothetical protein